MYYLQSRYYDPELGRFINADTFASTGQGIIGCNMFAYCGNNPANRLDPVGHTWIEFWERFKEAWGPVQENAKGVYVTVAAVSQTDSIVLGPADIISLGLVAITFFGCVMIATYNATITYAKEETLINKDAKSISVAVAQKEKNYQYWEAYRLNGQVVIGRGLTVFEASARVASGLDIMCANQDGARWILIINGYWNAVGPEIHGDSGYFWHYHPHRNTHAHIWYYEEG